MVKRDHLAVALSLGDAKIKQDIASSICVSLVSLLVTFSRAAMASDFGTAGLIEIPKD